MTKRQQKIFALVKKIPPGRVTTYQILAKAAGQPGAFRAVGNALAKNAHLIKIPCHRVVRSDLKVGEYQKGRAAKENLLRKEGIKIKKGNWRIKGKYLISNF